MDLGDGSSWLFVTLQILFVDLLLGADNALVIALACRSLAPQDVRGAATLGIAGAIVLRLVMTVLATSLLTIPLVKIVGALALTVIAINVSGGAAFELEPPVGTPRAAANLWSAAAVIIVADAAMGLDNVVALAAIARGNFWLLAAGVALSVPVLGYGGVILTQVLRRSPGLVAIGAAVLGWIAGGMAISDAAVAAWANLDAPGLVALAPALGAAFVCLYGLSSRRDASQNAISPARAAPAAPSASIPRPPRTGPKPSADPRPRASGDRPIIAGVLILALAAGALLVIVAYVDGYR